MSRAVSVRPRVSLVAPVAYYRHAALALHDAGYLDRWLTAPVRARRLPGGSLPLVGTRVARFNENRVFPEVADLPVRRLFASQLVARGADAWFRSHPEGSAFPVKNAAWDLEALLRNGKPDVVHAMSGVGRWVGRSARRRHAFVVCDVRSMHPDYQHAKVAPVLARAGRRYRAPNDTIRDRMQAEFERADLIICCSALARTSFVDAGFEPERVVSVPYGADIDAFRAAPHPPERFTVLFAGRERLRKGFLDLAAAARSLAPSSRLLVTGTPDAEVERLLAPVAADVELLGELDRASMAEALRRASVLVLPSLSEAFGLVVIEALASGVPVIVSSETGAAEAVREGVNGFVVAPGDPDGLADRLRALEAEPDRLDELRGSARATAEPYSWEAYGRHLVEVYRDVIAPRVV